MQKEIVLTKYYHACNVVLEKFNNLYFSGEGEGEWIGSQVGGVVIFGDYFFGMDFMVTALEYNATEKQVFDYYDLQVEEETTVNFKNYIKYYKGLSK